MRPRYPSVLRHRFQSCNTSLKTLKTAAPALVLTCAVSVSESVAATPIARAATELSQPNNLTQTTTPQLSTVVAGFEENRGQYKQDVLYALVGQGYRAFLDRSGAATVFPIRGDTGYPLFRMVLKGSQDSPRVQGVNLLPTRTNYFIGRSREQWHTGVRSYGRVRYCDVYRGVDLVYHQSREQLEYDFVVSPNTSPSTIRLGFDGAESFRLDEDGNLVLKSRKGEIRHRKPTIYQNRDGQRRIIAGGYRLLRSGEVSFHVAPYDRTRPLIIDPVVTYSTFLTRDDGFAWVHDIAG